MTVLDLAVTGLDFTYRNFPGAYQRLMLQGELIRHTTGGYGGHPRLGGYLTLAKRFSQMGGNSGPTFLRMIGKDTFILTPSVVSGLKHWGAADAPPKNRKDRAAVQSAFNAWAAETGRPLCQLSLILAASIED